MMERLSFSYLLSFWFNRVLIGLFIGLLPASLSLPKSLIIGLLAGIFISFAFYSATEFLDLTGFLVGGIYGIIIEYVTYIIKRKAK
jgi:predicted benzoate:H+ symporter BenE